MHKAYSLITVKEFDEVSGRRFSGIATTPTPDRVDDVMEPLGMEFSNPMPMHLFHHSDEPVGTVAFGRPTSKGIPFTATIPEIAEPGEVKTLTDKAAHFVKYGLIRAVSIGFRPLGDAMERMKSGGIRYLKTEILELSLVSIPANQEATITLVKSLDTDHAALGTGSAVDSSKPSGATDTPRIVKVRTDRSMHKSIADQIADFEATRQAKSARMDEIIQKSGEAGETLDEAQEQEHDGLEVDVKKIDEHLVRLHAAEERNKKAAKPVSGDTQEKASASRADTVIQVKSRTPPGIEFARYAMCLASAKGNTHQALEIAKVRYPDESRIQTIIKAAVESGTTIDATWAGNLVQYQDFAGDFIDFLRPQTIIGKFGANGVPALQRVPFNIRVARQTTGGSGYWVGEGKPKPLTKFGFDTVTMRWAKVANIAVLTEEEVRWSTPSAEAKVRDALAGALIERLDVDFVDPAKAAVSNVSPASITNGVVATAPTGVTAAFFRADVRSLMAPMIAADISLSSLVCNVPVGFEKAMLENVTQWLLKQEMKKRNKFIITKELIWDSDKNTRIETRLQPRYAQGVIYHKHGMGELEFQLTRFPTGTFDDAVDCLQALVQVLQFPKKVTVEAPKIDQFMLMRQHAIDHSPKKKERFLGFGKKYKIKGIQARKAII